MASTAREVDSAVQLRGQTEAVRQVEVRAETAGKIVSAPIRRGAFIEEGQLLCEIDPGTRAVSLAEAEALKGEAQSRLPAARAALSEAEAAVPAARARIAEAEAAVPAADSRLLEAEANVPAAEARIAEAEAGVPAAQAQLAEAEANVPAIEARLAEAEAAVPAAQAQLAEALANVPTSEARVVEARALLREAEINFNASVQLQQSGFVAQTKLANSEAAIESARANVQAALGGLEGAKAGVEAARSAVEGARASVASAKSQVEGARAAVESARSRVEGARAAVITAKSSLEGAKAAVISAQSSREGARAAVISAESALESALAGVESAKSGVEAAQAGIRSADTVVAAANKEIERLRIHAPFAGLLESDTAELGSLLQTGGLCATVIQLDPMKLVGYVPETDVDRIEVGARAGARLASGREVEGRVTFLSRSADSTTRTFRVELEVPNPDLAIRDGQTADILIQAEGRKAHMLPQSVLTLNDTGDLGVRAVVTGEALFMPAAVLRDTMEGVWVSGLPDSLDVIVVGQEFVTDGVAVAATYRDIGE